MDKEFKIFSSFEEAERSDDEYYRLMSVEERLKVCFDIRAMHFDLHGINPEFFNLRLFKTFEVEELPF